MKELIGRIAFYAGLGIAIIAGFTKLPALALWFLVLLGLVVGALNVTGKEVDRFLLSTVALLLVAVAIGQVFGTGIGHVLSAFMAFTAGSVFVVALREVVNIQKQR